MAFPGPEHVFKVGPATFVLERGMGLNYHCGLKMTTNIPFDLPYIPSNYAKYMIPQLQAIYDKHALLRKLGLEEDIFGIVHRQGTNQFEPQPVGYDIHRRVIRSGEFGDEHIAVARQIFLYGFESVYPPLEPVGNHILGPVDRTNYRQHLDTTLVNPPPGLRPPPGFELPTHQGRESHTSSAAATTDFEEPVSRRDSTQSGVGIPELGLSVHQEQNSVEDPVGPLADTNDQMQGESTTNNNSEATHESATGNQLPGIPEGRVAVLGSPDGPLATLAAENPNWSRWATSLEEFRTRQGIAVPSSSTGIFDTPFSVSRMVKEERQGIVRQASHDRHYLGDVTSSSYRRNELNLPENVNCTLFWRNLPEDIEPAELIQLVDTGALFSVHVRPAALPEHPSPAANVAFMKHAGAVRLLEKSRFGELILRGQRVPPTNVLWNKHGQLEHEDQSKSRVLKITGPRELMTWTFWSSYMEQCTRYQISHRVFSRLPSDPEKMVLEVGFARVDAQAESIYYAIRKELAFRGVFAVEYAADPCDQ